MDPRGSYFKPNSNNSTDQAIILPAKSCFLRILVIGWSVRTITWWLWKYCHNRRATVSNANTIFSTNWYLVYESYRTQLMKYTGRCSRFSCTKVALIVSFETDRYSYRGSSSTGRHMIGGLAIMALTSWKAFSHWSSHLSVVCFFIILRIGLILFINRSKKRTKDVSRLTSHCTSLRFFGLLISTMVVHLSKFASIPRVVNINPRNLPIDTSNTHFSVFNRILYFRT